MRSRRLILLGLVPALLLIATLVWLGALLPGVGEARRAEAKTACVKAVGELLALHQAPVGEEASVSAPASVSAHDDDHHEWKNTSTKCEQDKVQTIVNNSNSQLGVTEVHFTIENKGECPVLVGAAPQRGDFSGGRQQLIPPGAKERVHITIPEGQFLLASCQGVAGKKCDWEISHLSP